MPKYEQLYFIKNDRELTISNIEILSIIRERLRLAGYATYLSVALNRTMVKVRRHIHTGFQINIYDDILKTYELLKNATNGLAVYQTIKKKCKDNLTTKVISVSQLDMTQEQTDENYELYHHIIDIIEARFDMYIGHTFYW